MDTNDKPNEAITRLWESLCRGGQHWGRDVLLTEEEDTTFQCFFYLEDELPPEVGGHVQRFAKSFLELEGWKAKTKLSRRYLLLELSRA
jgi:hypothetical protein